jgi:hypothetical protein
MRLNSMSKSRKAESPQNPVVAIISFEHEWRCFLFVYGPCRSIKGHQSRLISRLIPSGIAWRISGA